MLLGKYATLSEWLRETALVYDRHGLRDAAGQLLELVGVAQALEDSADLGTKVLGAYGPLGANWDADLVDAVLASEELPEDISTLWPAVVAALGDPDDVLEAVTTLVREED